jgi:hypothetical protein
MNANAKELLMHVQKDSYHTSLLKLTNTSTQQHYSNCTNELFFLVSYTEANYGAI